MHSMKVVAQAPAHQNPQQPVLAREISNAAGQALEIASDVSGTQLLEDDLLDGSQDFSHHLSPGDLP